MQHGRYTLKKTTTQVNVSASGFIKEQARSDQVHMFLVESCMLKGLPHPNIHPVIGACLEPGLPPYVIYPYMTEGNLKKFLQKCLVSRNGTLMYEIVGTGAAPAYFRLDGNGRIINNNLMRETRTTYKPSSSSHAAELLHASGTAPTGFIGFGQSPMYVPASSTLDDMDANLDADVRMVLRKLTKRDAITKIKGLQEFIELCKEKSEDCLKAALPFWPRTYNRVAMDVDHRVRETSQQAMSALSLRVKRNLAPYLKNLMGAWLLSQCDTYPTVASAAQSAFQNAFPPAKQTEALAFCKHSILESLTENLVTHTQQTLSDPKTTDPEDMENKYHRVITSSLLAIRRLLVNIPANQSESLNQPITSLLDNAKFWKHAKSKVSLVRGAFFSCLAGLCQTMPELSAQYVSKMAPLILHNLDEKDPVICTHLWEATLSLVNFSEDCWKHVNVQKGFWPKLKVVLESGCYGNAVVIAPSLLPLLSRVPSDLFPDYAKFLNDFFLAFRNGLGSLQKSPSEGGAAVKAYMECAQYIIRQTEDTPTAAHVLLDQVLPVVQASLFEKASPLHQSPLYRIMGNLLTGLEVDGNSSSKQTASQFWSQLKESVEQNLSLTGSDFEERLVHLIKCLFYPKLETPQKTSKVKFKSNSENEIEELKSTDSASVNVLKRTNLGTSAKLFVQDITILTFDLAHKHFSTGHLKVFAQLLELDASVETISKVIECCHGEVDTETHSHYFVFEICIPWIQQMKARDDGGDVSEAFTHLVHIVCLFIPALETEAVSTLLEKLIEGCMDLEAECILFEKLFSLSNVSSSTRDWLRSSQFSDRLVARVQAIRRVTQADQLDIEIANFLSILTLVLTTRTDSADLLVQTECLEKVLGVLVQIAESLGSAGDRVDKLTLFAARASYSFYSLYEASLQTTAGENLLLKLFLIALCNNYSISGDILGEVRQACCEGISRMVEKTGGLLYDTGLLGKISAIVQQNVHVAVNSIEKLGTCMETVKSLLAAVLRGLPGGDSTNPVYVTYCSQLMVPVGVTLPSKVWSYLGVKGDHPCLPTLKGDNTFPTSSLFTSLYNCSLLSHIQCSPVPGQEGDGDRPMDVEASLSPWQPERVEKLVDCIQGLAIAAMFSQENEVVLTFSSVEEALSQLSSLVSKLVDCLSTEDRQMLWRLAYNRSDAELDFVLCQEKVLSLISSCQQDPLVLELAPILDRCSNLSESSLATLHNTADHLSPGDQLTLTEIMVARLLSLPQESVLQLDGGTGLLFALAKLVALVTSASQEGEAAELATSALDQVIAWKEENEDMLLFNCNVAESPEPAVMFNATLARYLSALVQHVSHKLSHEQWDFVMCSLASWVQSVEESEGEVLQSPSVQCFTVAVCRLVVQVTVCITERAGKAPAEGSSSYPPNLVTEWTEFFSESVFTALLPLYQLIYKSQERTSAGTSSVVLTAICEAVAHTPEAHVLEHKLPPLLVAGDLSPLPDNLQTLLNQICPLLLARERSVQVSAFWILNKIVDKLPEYDKEDKSIIEAATGGQEREEESKRSPPLPLMKVLDQASSYLEELLLGVAIDGCQPVSVKSREYHYAVAYVLSWKLILNFFGSAPSELRQEYSLHLRDLGYVERLMHYVYSLMPSNPVQLFAQEPAINVQGCGSTSEVQHLACSLYTLVLRTIPAMARNWWKDQDRKTAAFIDTFTTKHASPLLSAAELQSVVKTESKLEDMTIKARPTTREVIATYCMEEVTIEMVISLPQNYPLGNISVTSEKRVGVSKPQWEKWLLQLNIFLQHQNGNILDGLRLWKRNIDKRFEGVDECMICFYVLHGTNFQLPKITCRTCKKKFHSACLYKWFNTSHNCTCPLCRNVF